LDRPSVARIANSRGTSSRCSANPPGPAAELAVATVREHAGDMDVHLVAFDEATLHRYESLL